MSLFLTLLPSAARAAGPEDPTQKNIQAPSDESLPEEGISDMTIPFPAGYESSEQQEVGVIFDKVCGNGELEPGEECDDGNFISGDGCSAVCLKEAVCGNGILEAGEECDDGNLTDGDECSSTCTAGKAVAACGNGEVEEGEACDDGNRTNGDGCSSSCRIESIPGDGILGPDEECDDGNTEAGDGCSPAGNEEICGDGIVQDWEECENDSQCSSGTCVNCACTSCAQESQCQSDSDCGSFAPALQGSDCVRHTASCVPSQTCPGINTCQDSGSTEGGAWDSIREQTLQMTDPSGCGFECTYEVRVCGGSQTSALVRSQRSSGTYTASVGTSTIECSCDTGQPIGAEGNPEEGNACQAVTFQTQCPQTI